MADTIITNARVTTLDRANPDGQAVAVRGGLIQAVGPGDEVMRIANRRTRVIDAGGRRVIPGLNDSHTHLIRGGLNYNMELRWEGVPSLADALRMLREQAERTPAPQWVRVVILSTQRVCRACNLVLSTASKGNRVNLLRFTQNAC
jgi:predicted amidohydrolase YtcJ